MTIYSIKAVRDAFQRALALNPCRESAAAAVAQAMALPVETVRRVTETVIS